MAVDNITDNDIFNCAHTGADYYSWWKVYLAFPVWVTHVEIANRHNAGKKFHHDSLSYISTLLVPEIKALSLTKRHTSGGRRKTHMM